MTGARHARHLSRHLTPWREPGPLRPAPGGRHHLPRCQMNKNRGAVIGDLPGGMPRHGDGTEPPAEVVERLFLPRRRRTQAANTSDICSIKVFIWKSVSRQR
jgi:hypothetical protein